MTVPGQRWLQLLGRRRYHITWGGVFFLAGVVLVGVGAMVSGNNLLFLILAAMLAIFLVSGLVSRLCLAGLELDFKLPDHISARLPVSGKLHVRNVKSWMPSFSFTVAAAGEPPRILNSSLYVPVIAGGASLEEPVELRFPKRGTYRQKGFTVSTRFPFGFLEKSALVDLVREVVVYPSIDTQPGFEELLTSIAGDLEAHYRGRGSDFYRIRPYEAFESARHVDWRATAKTGDLQVREFAREDELCAEIYLDRDVAPELESWFERVVDCCAFLAWRITAKDASLRFRTQDFELRVPEEGDIYALLRFLALTHPISGIPPSPPVDPSSFQVVFSSNPTRFLELGWTPVHLLGPDDPALAVSESVRETGSLPK